MCVCAYLSAHLAPPFADHLTPLSPPPSLRKSVVLLFRSRKEEEKKKKAPCGEGGEPPGKSFMHLLQKTQLVASFVIHFVEILPTEIKKTFLDSFDYKKHLEIFL